jgi:hypothetical protein
MPDNHEAFLTMKEYLKLGGKGGTVNQTGTKFYVSRLMARDKCIALPISIAHLRNDVMMRRTLCLDS